MKDRKLALLIITIICFIILVSVCKLPQLEVINTESLDDISHTDEEVESAKMVARKYYAKIPFLE
jgi:hypothetical protein